MQITTKQIRSTLMSSLMLAGAYVVANILGAHDALALDQGSSGGIGAVVSNAQTGIKSAANLVYTAAYTGGVTALMMGAFKLKAHAENPGNTPMAQGLARIGVGSALIALPTVAQTGMESLLGTNTTTTLQGGTVTGVQAQ